MVEAIQEVICRHHEFVESSTQIGTCSLCGQRRQYLLAASKGKDTVIERGHIGGHLTMIHPPPLQETPAVIKLHSLPQRCGVGK